jgi:YidC/Oxa1 family membrane protein insertase
VGFIDTILDAFQSALAGLAGLWEPLTGVHAWGWAIISLTLIVRILLLPLAIKQIRSMRAMQAVQPRLKEIQKKHKVDRELMRKDPEKYKAKKAALQKEQMELFQAEGVNPAASCLPLLAQAPVFLALFRILQGPRAEELQGEPFYFFTSLVPDEGLTALVSAAGWPGWLLIVLMAATMFISQKQMMARQATAGTDNPMAQQQKIMLYVLPVFLAVISFQLPLGVLLYWVTTNLWQAGQQAIMLREVKHEAETGTLGDHPGGEAAKKTKRKPKGKGNGDAAGGGTGPGGARAADNGNGDAPSEPKPKPKQKPKGPDAGGSAPGGGTGKAGNRPSSNGRGNNGSSPSSGTTGGSASRKRDHLPRRGDRR